MNDFSNRALYNNLANSQARGLDRSFGLGDLFGPILGQNLFNRKDHNDAYNNAVAHIQGQLQAPFGSEIAKGLPSFGECFSQVGNLFIRILERISRCNSSFEEECLRFKRRIKEIDQVIEEILK